MALLDLLGRRWALRVLWELHVEPASFRSLRTRCDDVSPSVLNTRLAELRDARLVEASVDAGYTLSSDGVRLLALLAPLNAWAAEWARPRGRPSAAVAGSVTPAVARGAASRPRAARPPRRSR
jgi:DNA-binding HxlR family transcriptional regulator